MSDQVALWVKASTNSKAGLMGFVLDVPGKKCVKHRALVGSTDEFMSFSMAAPYDEFSKFMDQALFYTKFDKTETSDIDRWANNTFQNLEFIDMLFRSLKARKMADVEYRLATDLSRILGGKEPKLEFKLEKIEAIVEDEDPGAAGAAAADEPPPDSSMYVPLSFILSPLKGKYLSSLNPGDEVLVKITDSRHEKAVMFLAGLPEEDREATEFPAVLRSRRNNPGGGVYVFVTMPDGADGLVIEEEPGIRVKLPAGADTAPAPAQRSSAPAAGGGMGNLMENPKVLFGIAGAVVAVVIVIVIVLAL